MVKKIDICLSPALFSHYMCSSSHTVVVVDIFRATSTICTALYNGAKLVKTTDDIAIAEQYTGSEYLVAAERNTQRCQFAQLGNSPSEYTRERVNEKKILFTTTNGTKAIAIARQQNPHIVIGAFSNIEALTQQLLENHQDIIVLCSGWQNSIAAEDTLFAGQLAQELIQTQKFTHNKDTTNIAISLYQSAKNNPTEYLATTEHFNRLLKHDLMNDIEYCLKKNTTPIVPKYNYAMDYFSIK